MPAVLRVGLIGLDTSHVPAFTKVLNDPAYPNHVPGAKVVAAFPGGSPDIENSIGRVPGFTQEIKDKFGVEILDSPEAVAEACDLVFLESIDGRAHLPQLKQIIRFKRPVFIDKPLATTSAEAREIFQIASDAGVPVMSCSALRYAGNLTALLKDQEHGEIIGCDAFGPMQEVVEPPGLFWYGIHTVEILFRVMGPGCRKLQAAYEGDFDLIVGTWADGRIGSVRGSRKGHKQFGVTIQRMKGFQQANLSTNPNPLYDDLVAAIMSSLPNGRSDVSNAEMLEVIRFLEAGNESRKTGKVVEL